MNKIIMYAMCKPAMGSFILKEIRLVKSGYTIEYNNNTPYIRTPNMMAIDSMMAIESMFYGNVIELLYKALKIWGVNIQLIYDGAFTMNILYKDAADDNKILKINRHSKLSIRCQEWCAISKENAIWNDKKGIYWEVYTIGNIKMYQYDNNTQILDRYMLMLLVDPFTFFLRMGDKIKESSNKTRTFFKIIWDAINSDLSKYMLLVEMNNVLKLNDDVVDVISGMWIASVMVEFMGSYC